jgi:hypothetical protein
MTRRPFPGTAFAPAIIPIAATASALALLAGCGGGGGSPGAASGASATTAATTSTQNGTTTVQIGSFPGRLAFARCMRSHGIPNWPDPTSDGGFDKFKLRQLRLNVSRVRAIEETFCKYDFEPGGQPQGQTITPADRVDYLRAAACIRSHGVPDFPDPTFQNSTVRFNIPPNIDPNSPQAKRAEAICVKLIPPGLPYSHSDAPHG